MDEEIRRLVTLDSDERSLAIVLGDKCRQEVEDGFNSGGIIRAGSESSIDSITRSKKNVSMLFLNKLQYLFMYLTQLEMLSEEKAFADIVIYGLDDLIGLELLPNAAELRDCNLIYTAAFRAARRTGTTVEFVYCSRTNDRVKQMKAFEEYWRQIC